MSTKTLTKEQLAAKLNGCEDPDQLKDCIIAATDNNLVIVFGGSDDLVEFRGAIYDEVGAYNGGIVHLTRKGFPESNCNEGKDCPYYQQWLKSALQTGEVRQIKAFWEGECKNEKMNETKFAEIGKPTWCYETDMPHATFSMYEAEDDERYFYCLGFVIDIDEVWGNLTNL